MTDDEMRRREAEQNARWLVSAVKCLRTRQTQHMSASECQTLLEAIEGSFAEAELIESLLDRNRAMQRELASRNVALMRAESAGYVTGVRDAIDAAKHKGITSTAMRAIEALAPGLRKETNHDRDQGRDSPVGER